MKKLSIVVGFLFSSLLFGEIREIHQLDQIKEIAPESLSSSDWILFDIDFTLTMPDHPMLSMSHMKQNKQRLRQEQAKMTEEEWDLVPMLLTTHASNKLTEPEIPQLLKHLIDRGATLFGLTLADTSVLPDVGAIPMWRSHELKRLDIGFSSSNERIEFLEFSPTRGTYPLFTNGVLYCNAIHEKGVVLSSFIKKFQTQSKPTRIIFIDDTLKNLYSVEEEMEKIGIPYLGLHYVPKEKPTLASDEEWEKVWQAIHERAKRAVIPTGILQTRSPSAIEWAIESSSAESLIIFDVGNILLAPHDAALHLKHRPWIKGWLEQRGIRELDKTLFFTLDQQMEWNVVNPKIVDLIAQGKTKSKIIALSKYWIGKPYPHRPSFEEQRLLSLKNVGIDFEEPFPQAAGWSHEELKATYGHGLIQTEAKLKGPVLLAFLKHLNWQPKSIVFIDDLIVQCESIAAAGRELNIPVLCIHYTEAVDQVPPLDPVLADLQLRTLIDEGHWLSDEAGRKLLDIQTATVHPEQPCTQAGHQMCKDARFD